MDHHDTLCARCRDLLHDTLFSAAPDVEVRPEGRVLRCKTCETFWYKSPEGHWRHLGEEVPEKVEAAQH
jgi:uncharacterized protein with PIN domain